MPAVSVDVIEKTKFDLCSDHSPDAPLFEDSDGSPIFLNTMRLYFKELCSRIEGWDRDPDF